MALWSMAPRVHFLCPGLSHFRVTSETWKEGVESRVNHVGKPWDALAPILASAREMQMVGGTCESGCGT